MIQSRSGLISRCVLADWLCLAWELATQPSCFPCVLHVMLYAGLPCLLPFTAGHSEGQMLLQQNSPLALEVAVHTHSAQVEVTTQRVKRDRRIRPKETRVNLSRGSSGCKLLSPMDFLSQSSLAWERVSQERVSKPASPTTGLRCPLQGWRAVTCTLLCCG